MKNKKLMLISLVLFLFISSIPSWAAHPSVYLVPAHDSYQPGFELTTNLEFSLNYQLAQRIAKHLKDYQLSYQEGEKNSLSPEKIQAIRAYNPDIILGIHHHGKYGIHVEYNAAGSHLAYQIAAYFAGKKVPYKLVPYGGAWLFDEPQPVVTIIINEEIAADTDWAFIAQILKGEL